MVSFPALILTCLLVLAGVKFTRVVLLDDVVYVKLLDWWRRSLWRAWWAKTVGVLLSTLLILGLFVGAEDTEGVAALSCVLGAEMLAALKLMFFGEFEAAYMASRARDLKALAMQEHDRQVRTELERKSMAPQSVGNCVSGTSGADLNSHAAVPGREQ